MTVLPDLTCWNGLNAKHVSLASIAKTFLWDAFTGRQGGQALFAHSRVICYHPRYSHSMELRCAGLAIAFDFDLQDSSSS